MCSQYHVSIQVDTDALTVSSDTQIKRVSEHGENSSVEEWGTTSFNPGMVQKFHRRISRTQVIEESDAITEAPFEKSTHTRRVLTRRQYDRQQKKVFGLIPFNVTNHQWSSRSETVRLEGKPIQAYRLLEPPTKAEQKATVWVDSQHNFVRATTTTPFGKVRFDRVSMAQALAPLSLSHDQHEQEDATLRQSPVSERDAAAKIIAKVITEMASSKSLSVTTLTIPLPETVMVVHFLPTGTYAEPCDAPKDESGQTIRGAKFVLPDGRQCFVVSRKDPHPSDDRISAYRFRYHDGAGNWGNAIVPAMTADANPVPFAKKIQDTAKIPGKLPPPILITARAADTEKVRTLLGEGTVILRAQSADYQDSAKNPLPITSYTLPDGRVCLVVDVAVPQKP